MRIRLFLSYVLVILVTIICVFWFTQQQAVNEIRTFVFRGSLIDPQQYIDAIKNYYIAEKTLIGSEKVLLPLIESRNIRGQGQGQGQGRTITNLHVRLADTQGMVLYDNLDSSITGTMTSDELSTSYPIQNEDGLIGYLLLEGGSNFNRSDESFLISRLNQSALIAGIISLGVSLVLSVLLTVYLLRPVRDLKHAANQLGEGKLSQRVTVRGSDELADLATTFNYMADSLEKAEDDRKKMTADIAHELRTPLAIQRAHLEAIQDGVYPFSTENLQIIVDQNQSLAHLVSDLQTLAQADSGKLTLDKTHVDLSMLVRNTIGLYEPQAAARGIKINVSTEPSVETNIPETFVDPLRIEQILKNLLSNAIRHTPDNGYIQVKLIYTDSDILLKVIDNGPGIPDEAIPRLFERFYRADNSRNRNQGGSGLGLAISKQLAEAHGGTLSVKNRPEGGAEFVLILPNQENKA